MVSDAMKTSNDEPFTSFIEPGKSVIVRDRTFDKHDAGFRRAIACVSLYSACLHYIQAKLVVQFVLGPGLSRLDIV